MSSFPALSFAEDDEAGRSITDGDMDIVQAATTAASDVMQLVFDARNGDDTGRIEIGDGLELQSDALDSMSPKMSKRGRKKAIYADHCANCNVDETTLWRRVGGLILCNSCGLHFTRYGSHRRFGDDGKPIRTRKEKIEEKREKAEEEVVVVVDEQRGDSGETPEREKEEREEKEKKEKSEKKKRKTDGGAITTPGATTTTTTTATARPTTTAITGIPTATRPIAPLGGPLWQQALVQMVFSQGIELDRLRKRVGNLERRWSASGDDSHSHRTIDETKKQ